MSEQAISERATMGDAISRAGLHFRQGAERFLEGAGAPPARRRRPRYRWRTAKAATASGSPQQGLDVLTIDYSPAALAKAQALRGRARRAAAHRGHRRLCLALADERIRCDRGDLHLRGPHERPAFFANLKGALKPGGLLLMQGYRPEQLEYRTGGPPDAERLLHPRDPGAGFGDMAELDIREHDSTISEGSAHVGMSALIDLVARK